ncbi:MAG TPA: hypothetical protein GX517_02155 [Alicyclobacillus sp.]|nr:hypothetical protein [Alicyclobacillus sp.]
MEERRKPPTMFDFLGKDEKPKPPETRPKPPTMFDFLPEERKRELLAKAQSGAQSSSPPRPNPPAYTILVDGEEKAAAASWREALGALEATVRAVRTVPGRTAKVELRDGEGKVLRTCYLPHWEGK